MHAPRVLAIGIFARGDRILAAHGADPVTGQRLARPVGGGVEDGEDPADALAREVREELGLDAREARLLGVLDNAFTYAGRPHRETVHVFDARLHPEPPIDARLRVATSDGPREAWWATPRELADAGALLVPRGVDDLLRKG